jgi:hypothetical protein
MQDIRFVMYETCKATFTFKLADAIGHLKPYVEQNVREASEILEAVSSSPLSAIKVTSDYFAYMVLDLIKAGKGHAYCKTCKETYDSSQLTSIPLGFGRTPFAVNLKSKGGIIKRLFGRKQLVCGDGGEEYLCPHRHELIGMLTWTGLIRIPK